VGSIPEWRGLFGALRGGVPAVDRHGVTE